MANFSKDNSPANKQAKQLIEQHEKLVHTDDIKVISHVQRESNDWFVNTLMLENIDVPFKYKRKKLYKLCSKYKIFEAAKLKGAQIERWLERYLKE